MARKLRHDDLNFSESLEIIGIESHQTRNAVRQHRCDNISIVNLFADYLVSCPQFSQFAN